MEKRRLLTICLVLLCVFAWHAPDSATGQQTPMQNVSWPQTITVDGASVAIYQPQVMDWQNQETLTTRAAVSVTRSGDKSPVLGTIKVSFATRTDAATGNVVLSDPQLIASHFPALNTEQAAELEGWMKKALPAMQTPQIPMQTVLLSLKQSTHRENVVLDNKPPTIFYSDKPASLVVFDGEPVLAPVGNTGLSFAVNTNWNVFTDGKDWYLLNNGLWLEAPSYSGPYNLVTSLPAAFNAIPADKNFADVRKAIPPRVQKSAMVPAIFVSTVPADIIVTDGPPRFEPITGTGLQVVKNTNCTLYFEPVTGRFFVLISGRWFSAQGFNGPWIYASDNLPADFALIPPESPEARVLPSVPGTSEAQLAVLQAQIPHMATISKKAAPPVVVYSGAPRFKPIPGTTLMYAVNTPFEVIATGGQYYVCYEGAWYVGLSATGPWVLAETVPEVIYTIPPSCPLYNVTYVSPYWVTPTDVIYGYTAGYLMGFVTAGVLVYGTGYYYPPVVVAAPVPIYYPYPYTYVGNVWYSPEACTWVSGSPVYGGYSGVAKGATYYNPATGAWASGGAIYGPYGGTGAFSYYNPATGAYAHGNAAWTSDGGSAVAGYTNPRTGITASTSQTWNPYSRSGSSTITSPSQTVYTRSGSNARGSAGAYTSTSGAKGAGYHAATGGTGAVAKTQSGDTYAGHDGNVYRHNSSGWSKWNNGTWQPVSQPSTTTPSRVQSRQSASASTAPQGTTASRTTAPRTTAQRGMVSQGTVSQRTGPQWTAPQATTGVQTTERLQSGPLGTRQGGTTLQPPEGSIFQQLEQDRRARAAGSPDFLQRGFFQGRPFMGRGRFVP